MEAITGIQDTEQRTLVRNYLVFYLRVYDGISSKVIGHLIDISKKGIMILCDTPIEINEDFRLRMNLPTSLLEKKEVMFTATSRWCKADVNPDFYLAGFQMQGLGEDAEESILGLIDQYSYQPSQA